MSNLTFLLRKRSGDYVTIGELGLTTIPDLMGQFWTGHTFESALHQIKEHPELGFVSTPSTTEHLDPQVVGCFGCHCDGCYRDHAEEQAAEIDAEMAIERYYEGGWDKSGEYEAFDRYERSMGLIG